MGAGNFKMKNNIESMQATLNKTVTATTVKKVTDLFTQQIQQSQNKNRLVISDIVCGGNINIGTVNQNITVAQDLGSIARTVSEQEIKSIVESAMDAVQTSALDSQKTPDFQPFFGNFDSESLISLSNTVKNEVVTSTNIQEIYKEFLQQSQIASQINETTIKNLVCGGDLKIGDINQDIQALQVASKLSESISKLIFSSKTLVDTISKQDAKLKASSGIGGVFESIGKAISGIVDSVGGVVGKVGGIYAIVSVVAGLIFLGIIVVVVMNIGKIGAAASGVMETASKTGMMPKGRMGKIPKIPKIANT